MKFYYDKKIKKKMFELDDMVLLYNSILHLFHRMLKSWWHVPFTMVRVFPHGAIELKCNGEDPFKVNE